MLQIVARKSTHIMNPRLSVITVCRNSQSTIVPALRSVAAQTYAPIEHLIIDGASTDDTISLVNTHARPGFRLVSEPDNGIYEAMNKGLRMATGEFVVFLNSDDFYVDPNAVSDAMRELDRSGAEIVFGDIAYVKRDNPAIRKRTWRTGAFEPGGFQHGWAPPHTAFFARRTRLIEIGGFDLRYRLAADFDLMFRALCVEHMPSSYLPREMVHMRIGGTTNGTLRNVMLQNLEILRSMNAQNMCPEFPSYILMKLVRKLRERFRIQPSTNLKEM